MLRLSAFFVLAVFSFACAAERPSFEAASLKPSHSTQEGMILRVLPGGRLHGEHLTVMQMVAIAWSLQKHQVTSRIDWLSTEYFDLEASAGHAAGEAELRQMMKTLIEDRFHLKSYLESRQMTIYSLVQARKGIALAPNIHASPDGDCGNITKPDPNVTAPTCGGELARMGSITGHQTHMDELATNLAVMVDREVVNQTGVHGSYDLTLTWSPDESTGPSIFTALEEQLGLRLEAGRAAVHLLVIDGAQKLESN